MCMLCVCTLCVCLYVACVHCVWCVCIVSWGNFGHGATSVKKSLRNHFGRINNV